jgi:glycosyltransferase involved in cell wall biosynthesis
MAYISCLLKKKQIIIMHDAGTFSHPYFFKTVFRTWYKFAISVLARFSLHIITVSEFSKKALVKHTGIKECKITVIKNSPEHIKRYGEPDIAFKRKVEELIPFFLGVSSVHPHKNFEILSKAIISANLGEYRVVIAGGSYGKSFDKVILDDSIVRLGYVSNEELKHLYSRASLFIFPSLFEGFGIPPLEAMTVGCPVLSSYSTAMPEVLGDACEYFNPKDEKELVIKLEMLINNKARLQELQRKGYERVPLYSWQNSAEALLKLVKEFA